MPSRMSLVYSVCVLMVQTQMESDAPDQCLFVRPATLPEADVVRRVWRRVLEVGTTGSTSGVRMQEHAQYGWSYLV